MEFVFGSPLRPRLNSRIEGMIFPGARRRGDRVTVLFAAVHESGSGTSQPSIDVGSTAASGGNPDIEPTSAKDRV
jgi:hypothetical protein